MHDRKYNKAYGETLEHSSDYYLDWIKKDLEAMQISLMMEQTVILGCAFDWPENIINELIVIVISLRF